MLRNVIDRMPMIWVYRSFLVIGLIAISILAVVASQSQITVSSIDKVNHYIAFFYLSLCLDGSMGKRRFLPWKLPALLSYAVLIEVVQLFLPYREFSLLDMVADGFGIFSYWLIRKPVRRFFM